PVRPRGPIHATADEQPVQAGRARGIRPLDHRTPPAADDPDRGEPAVPADEAGEDGASAGRRGRSRRRWAPPVSEIRGSFDARGRRFAVAAGHFNEMVVSKLVEGALACFRAHGIPDDEVLVVWTPGAFELPLAAKRLAESGLYDAVVCL